MLSRSILPVLSVLLAFAASPGAAMSFERCSKVEIAYATAAVDGAREVIMRASARVGETAEYLRWFGDWHPVRAETVRANLKSVDNALDSNDLVLVCPNVGEDGCALGTYANVLPDRPYRVNLCAAFFQMPTMQGIVASSMAFDTGTREGTIIHEVSHFLRTAATDDHCYTRTDCSRMAEIDPVAAIDNADSYQYFAEDVLFAWQAGEID